MNGSGCKKCPVEKCETLNYRGSVCAVQRARLGLGDPMTNADRIRAMSDEELSTLLCDISDCSTCRWGQYAGCVVKEWLKQPAEV